MMKIDRTVATSAPTSEVFDFLADFTTTEQWDPGTVRTERISGDGGVGTAYANTSRFLGRTTDLTYVVEVYEPGTRVVLRGENKSVVAHDTMTFVPTATGGTSVRYVAEFDLKGLARMVAPLLTPAFTRLGDDASAQMRTTLDRLGR
ncbi:polyketide cyclase [Nocardioides luteus]|uniref:Polyketide cyclase n=2 Tax=Nocardioides luteus TaxID=1844 RepID=A0A1J4N713_9ACTN|nr:polyketide cyclase [Nocardioides luteus]